MDGRLKSMLIGKKPWRTLLRVLAMPLVLVVFMLFYGCYGLSMPGGSFSGELPEASPRQVELARDLKAHVDVLASGIGERNSEVYDGMLSAVSYVEGVFRGAGLDVRRLDYHAKPALLARARGAEKETAKLTFTNVIAEVKGLELPDEIVVFGAHYDTAPVSRCVGADDNGTGVAATLELARHFSKHPQKRTLRFIAFANEEPPFFWTNDMGSRVCARESSKKGERIVAAIVPDSIGYYSDASGSQSYPWPLNKLYPDKGDFIAFVGGVGSAGLVKDCVGIFRDAAEFPSEGAALPMFLPGVGWSDHWSYAKEGYPAVMVTDTAPFRNPHYHTSGDTIDKVDFDRMARVVEGLESVIGHLAGR